MICKSCLNTASVSRNAKFPVQLLPHPQIGRNQKNVGGDPCHRAGEAHGLKARRRDPEQADQSPGQHFEHTGKHRQLGKAQTLNHETEHIHKGQRRAEGHPVHDKILSVRQNRRFLRADEQAQQCGAKILDQEKGDDGIDQAECHAGAHSLADPIQLFRADILAAVGGHGGAQRVQRAADQLRHLIAGGDRRHRVGTQPVNARLQHNAANGGDGIL